MTAHYIQPLQKTSLPGRHIIFDTETRSVRRAGALEHRFACAAVMTFNHLQPVALDPQKGALRMWEWITAECRKGHRTVAWAHNLSFDLRVSEALRWLPHFGFKLQGIVLERTASWASWTHPQKGSLLCCDLYAWLPRPLDDIAKEMGIPRSGFDYENATLQRLQGRCVEDVKITHQAVREILAWLASEDAGPFRLTGSGQAHACWRKRFKAGRDSFSSFPSKPGLLKAYGVWVHGDPRLREIEREAMWTGRCEAWRHGEVNGPLYEYDMNLAYCRIAANHNLPIRYRGEHHDLSVAQHQQLVREGYAVLSEVTVIDNMDQPILPCRVGERVIWPMGTFSTVVWEPELDVMLTNVSKYAIQIKRCWTYYTGPALKPMAEWIIAGLSDPKMPGPIRLLLKHWARALIGRMALRYRRWEDYGTMPDLGLALWVGYDEDGIPTENLQVGHDRFQLAEMMETDTSVPQITGWVMSRCRAQLWEAIQAHQSGDIIYMDTDSLLIKPCGGTGLTEGSSYQPFDFVMEQKARWSHATIHGPRNLELDWERRLSGIPRTAVRKGPLEYEGTIMRGVKESLIRSELDHVAQLSRPYEIKPSDPRREHLPGGMTRPYVLKEGDQ